MTRLILPPPLDRLTAALTPALVVLTLALALPANPAQAQTTCPSGHELISLPLTAISCERFQQCGSQGEVAVRFASALQSTGSGDMFRILKKYRYCTQGKGSWTEEQWMDKCTQQGWKVVQHFLQTDPRQPAVSATAAFRQYAIPAGVDLQTTSYCVAHKTKSQYKLYFDGNGFVYEQQHCEQDRDNNGSYERRVSGSPNCSPVGSSPTGIPKWVAPWD